MNTRETQLKAFDRLLGIMEELREKCPWDKKKANASNAILPLKTYELGMPS
jgi:XTP/dITP diphosphohydrolase